MLARRNWGRVQVSTVDSIQSQEADLVILLTTRTRTSRAEQIDLEKGEFWSDSKRSNVALSKPRHGLFVIGDLTLLSRKGDVWRRFIWEARKFTVVVDRRYLDLMSSGTAKRLGEILAGADGEVPRAVDFYRENPFEEDFGGYGPAESNTMHPQEWNESSHINWSQNPSQQMGQDQNQYGHIEPHGLPAGRDSFQQIPGPSQAQVERFYQQPLPTHGFNQWAYGPAPPFRSIPGQMFGQQQWYGLRPAQFVPQPVWTGIVPPPPLPQAQIPPMPGMPIPYQAPLVQMQPPPPPPMAQPHVQFDMVNNQQSGSECGSCRHCGR